jgi:hypothetical protein
MRENEQAETAVLRRVADALGMTVDRFFTAAQARGTDINSDECLRLWSEIATEDGRRQALEAMRAIIGREQR